MFDRKSSTFFGGTTLVFVTIACSLFTSSPNPQISTASPIISVPISPTSTQIIALPYTPTVQPGIRQEWKIDVGDLQYIGVSADGTVYGVAPDLYAVISKDGDVMQTNKVDLGYCLRDNFTGGSGDTEIDRWFVINPTGEMLTIFSATPCAIFPGNPPTIEPLRDSGYFPYADSFAIRKTPSTPNGFMNNFGGYLYFSSLNSYDFFISVAQRRAAFVDHNGELRYFELTEDVDLEKHLNELRIAVTPWDHVYYTYPVYDSLGNNIGQKNIKVDENGISTAFEKFPVLGSQSSSFNDLGNIANLHPIYLSQKGEIYLYERDGLKVYDLDFEYLREYAWPSNFPIERNGTLDRSNSLFVGHDGAIYLFDTRNDANGKTLTKFSTTSDAVRLPEVTTHQAKLDQEATTFRDQALNALEDLDTMEYTSMITYSGSTEDHGTETARATRNAFQYISHLQNGQVGETIQIDGTSCHKADNGPWSCNTETPWTPFLGIMNVLKGSPSGFHPKSESLGYESKLSTYAGVQCRSYLVEERYKSDSEEEILVTEVCFDLDTYFPIHWVSKYSYTANNSDSYDFTTDSFDFKFNVPVNITLPQP